MPAARMTAEPSRIIEIANERGELVTEVDGFVYWWPGRDSAGFLSEGDLRELADELNRRNKDWQEQVARDLAIRKDSTCPPA